MQAFFISIICINSEIISQNYFDMKLQLPTNIQQTSRLLPSLFVQPDYIKQVNTVWNVCLKYPDMSDNEPHVGAWGQCVFSHLVKQRVQHADAEHSACSERQPEHEGQVGALITLDLHRRRTQKTWEEHSDPDIIISLFTVFVLLCYRISNRFMWKWRRPVWFYTSEIWQVLSLSQLRKQTQNNKSCFLFWRS